MGPPRLLTRRTSPAWLAGDMTKASEGDEQQRREFRIIEVFPPKNSVSRIETCIIAQGTMANIRTVMNKDEPVIEVIAWIYFYIISERTSPIRVLTEKI